ncbi:uncharacterized metal-binding protein YceD (DUF177 family) [Mangrovibacterium marinum]|uniref:Uncharacterized metal-binding protein YceD (DUF177 family) n=2 Tax=Mangrovibacterium marinum TaxID=1639118 RepID=A0A2T5C6F8_9BACT|nr:uncharacterized metal-binding protein YceD (DUF177 family) [Mangrovibacterium marinum]
MGSHEFDFQIDKKFFDHFDGGIAEDGDVQAKVILEKQSALIVLWFHISGTVKVQCDRCLDMYDQAVASENRVFIKYGEDSFEDGDDVIWVDVNEHQVNIAQMLYDFIMLALPIRQVHPKDKNGKRACNPEMLKKLKELSYNSNSADQEEQSDSRWDDLKKLLENE